MKFRIILASVAAALIAAVLIFVLTTRSATKTDTLTVDEIRSMKPDAQAEVVSRAFSSGNLPEGEEAEFIAWLSETNHEKAFDLIRNSANKTANLPTYLSDAALLLVKAGKTETGVRIVGLGQNLFPNNPDILGITGIVAYLGGRPVEARKFLEEAETWGQNRPIIEFYLGGILVESESMADLARGKNLLFSVLNGQDEELAELAGLILLTKPTVPLIDEDVDLLLDKMEELNVFRPENDNLWVEALRMIINRLVPFRPTEALELADLLMQYPGATSSDRMGMIQLAQDQKQVDIARQQIDKLEVNLEELPADSDMAKWLKRLLALQYLAEGSFDEGLAAFVELVETQPNEPALRNAFNTALSFELPMDTEEGILEEFLKLPVESTENSLKALSRLVGISPLEEDRWVAYARDNLIHRDPVIVGQWLMAVDAVEATIEKLSAKEEPLTGNERVALIEAYLYRDEVDEADAVLQGADGSIEASIDAYLHCRILLQQENYGEAFEIWKVAQQRAASGGRFALLKNLGFLALELDQEVNALQSLYTAFSAGVPFSREQANQLLELTLKFGNLRQSIEISQFLANEFPDEATYANNLAYFHFLAEENIEESVEEMRSLVEEYPDINPFRLTLALGLVKAGRTNEASRIVQSTNIDWTNADIRSQMIYAVVLAASNQRVVAEGLMRNFDVSELIPEEQALLEAF